MRPVRRFGTNSTSAWKPARRWDRVTVLCSGLVGPLGPCGCTSGHDLVYAQTAAPVARRSDSSKNQLPTHRLRVCRLRPAGSAWSANLHPPFIQRQGSRIAHAVPARIYFSRPDARESSRTCRTHGETWSTGRPGVVAAHWAKAAAASTDSVARPPASVMPCAPRSTARDSSYWTTRIESGGGRGPGPAGRGGSGRKTRVSKPAIQRIDIDAIRRSAGCPGREDPACGKLRERVFVKVSICKQG
jgi:hypothetical protein